MGSLAHYTFYINQRTFLDYKEIYLVFRKVLLFAFIPNGYLSYAALSLVATVGWPLNNIMCSKQMEAYMLEKAMLSKFTGYYLVE